MALNGAFKHNPQRKDARKGEPAPVVGVGLPPDNFDFAHAAAWHEIVAQAHAGTLCAADRLFLEYACTVLCEMRADMADRAEWHALPPEDRPKHRPIVDVKLGVRWEAICGRLGLTPADRSRVTALEDKAQSDPFAEFRTAGKA